MQKFSLSLLSILLLFVCTPRLAAQTTVAITATDAPAKKSGDKNATVFRYLFENERFTTQRIRVEFDQAGQGIFSLTKKNSDEVVNKLQLSAGLVAQLQGLLDAADFLAGSESYQHKKDFSHLGAVSITYARNGRERTAKFNYTEHPLMNRIAELFRNIANQEERIYDLQNAREADPLSTPKQMQLLENEFKSHRLADPARLITYLEELKLDEGIPLISRNHADRLIRMIQKQK
ncbi:MAG: hypothetical protein ACKV2V_15600 [Blastocatellia bacterium]